jgi:hypothetical protein
MTTSTIADQLKRQGSQGAKVVTCVVCKGDIQPFAGRPVSFRSKFYAHHPGQCDNDHERNSELRETAGQGALFAWSCRHVEPAADLPRVCNEQGTDRGEYEQHMRSHGETALAEYRPIKLRKTAPGAKLPKLTVNPFKWVTWHETLCGEWQAGVGNPVLAEADRKGQFWSEGPDPHSIWVVPLHPAPWELQGKPAKPVCLYSHGGGTWSTDWSRAKWDRREANRRAKRNAA